MSSTPDITEICRGVSVDIIEMYSRGCLRHIEVPVPLIDRLCSDKGFPQDIRRGVLERVSRTLGRARELCVRAYEELGGDMSSIEKWGRYDELYLSVKEAGEALREGYERGVRYVRTVSITIYTILLLAILEILLVSIGRIESPVAVLGLMFYILVLSIPAVMVSERPSLSYMLLGLLMIPGLALQYLVGVETLSIVSYTALVVASLYLSRLVERGHPEAPGR